MHHKYSSYHPLDDQCHDLALLQAKMQEYREAGVRLGWLINPQQKTVEIYRHGHDVEVRDLPAELSGEPVLSGFRLRLSPYA